ncbi:MAG: alpha/beta fold hydrolase [Patescibacteria group bacterium]|nr:alpha/beta fold hydrolase [Patescibacteria group bacterium]
MNYNENISSGNPFFLRGNKNIGILLLHGWTSPPDELLPLAKYLNSFGWTVYAPLLLGHGTKPEDLEHVKWKDWLSQSREELEKLKEHSEKIFVGGISMGGNLAMMISKDESVAGIFTMGAAMRYKLHNLAKIALFFMGLTKTYRRKYYPPWVRKKMGNRKVYMYYPIESAKEVVRLAEATGAFLPQITKPILVMQSTSDHMVSKKSPKMILEGVKSKIKEIFWIENAYHVFASNKDVHKRIGEFISRVIS